jgi:hypothetical protein
VEEVSEVGSVWKTVKYRGMCGSHLALLRTLLSIKNIIQSFLFQDGYFPKTKLPN